MRRAAHWLPHSVAHELPFTCRDRAPLAAPSARCGFGAPPKGFATFSPSKPRAPRGPGALTGGRVRRRLCPRC
eukprot:3818592-Alexandrium_andersonii.AAC.1